MKPDVAGRGEPERLLNVKEAAQFLGVKPRTIYAWVAEGRIPYRRAGTALRFLRLELLEWTVAQVK
jgi:excisionase family DNA binding protein